MFTSEYPFEPGPEEFCACLSSLLHCDKISELAERCEILDQAVAHVDICVHQKAFSAVALTGWPRGRKLLEDARLHMQKCIISKQVLDELFKTTAGLQEATEKAVCPWPNKDEPCVLELVSAVQAVDTSFKAAQARCLSEFCPGAGSPSIVDPIEMVVLKQKEAWLITVSPFLHEGCSAEVIAAAYANNIHWQNTGTLSDCLADVPNLVKHSLGWQKMDLLRAAANFVLDTYEILTNTAEESEIDAQVLAETVRRLPTITIEEPDHNLSMAGFLRSPYMTPDGPVMLDLKKRIALAADTSVVPAIEAAFKSDFIKDVRFADLPLERIEAIASWELEDRLFAAACQFSANFKDRKLTAQLTCVHGLYLAIRDAAIVEVQYRKVFAEGAPLKDQKASQSHANVMKRMRGSIDTFTSIVRRKESVASFMPDSSTDVLHLTLLDGSLNIAELHAGLESSCLEVHGKFSKAWSDQAKAFELLLNEHTPDWEPYRDTLLTAPDGQRLLLSKVENFQKLGGIAAQSKDLLKLSTTVSSSGGGLGPLLPVELYESVRRASDLAIETVCLTLVVHIVTNDVPAATSLDDVKALCAKAQDKCKSHKVPLTAEMQEAFKGLANGYIPHNRYKPGVAQEPVPLLDGPMEEVEAPRAAEAPAAMAEAVPRVAAVAPPAPAAPPAASGPRRLADRMRALANAAP